MEPRSGYSVYSEEISERKRMITKTTNPTIKSSTRQKCPTTRLSTETRIQRGRHQIPTVAKHGPFRSAQKYETVRH